jgi:signal-transduction protein with cAMP-binding, CBS, and nucleotidyltransferase domain
LLETKVGEIARRSLVTIEEDALVVEAVRLMVDRKIGSVVVTSKKQPVGIVTRGDLLKKILVTGRSTETTKVIEIMTPTLISIDQNRSLGEAIDLMSRKGIRRLLVTQQGEIVGIFTHTDVMNLNRLCLHCGREIKSILEYGDAAEPYTECQCGSRYHVRCANDVVHCVDCSRTLVASVVYPEPFETMSG